MTELVISNARIVTSDAVIHGTVQLRDGVIADVSDGPALLPGALDFDGDYLLPGLVELHTDNLERHLSPRPGVRWPAPAAVVAHDAQIAGAGITTVLDALSVGDVPRGQPAARQPDRDGRSRAGDESGRRAQGRPFSCICAARSATKVCPSCCSRSSITRCCAWSR